MSALDSDDGFVGKWQARWPEWSQAIVFVPAAQRERVRAWFALLQELGDAALGGSDPTPGLAKLAWWQDELRGWSKGARRHPLGSVLQPLAAPWDGLALALPALQASRRRPGEASAPASVQQDFARAVAACESALFGGGEAAAAHVAAALAIEHALQHPETAPPPADGPLQPARPPRP